MDEVKGEALREQSSLVLHPSLKAKSLIRLKSKEII
tara:strand:+ start:4055 stop:4162 length:108 start_codon:yes stop_codon:yes gene_type:complete